MLRAVLFDLDGTLLDIDLDGFLREYFSALGPSLSGMAGAPGAPQIVSAVVESTGVMCASHPGRTNREAFHAEFLALSGVDLDRDEVAAHVDRFYREVFPQLKKDHSPMAGAHNAVRAARDAGLLTAVATNPIFPRAAVEERMRWAELEDSWFDLVTSYETMSACKPDPEYYLQVARELGVDASECLMIGDDAELDLPASRVGMKTFYVGESTTAAADWRGSLDDVAALLAGLVA